MFTAIADWIARLSHAGEDAEGFAAADPRLSVAALLVHVIAVDGRVTDAERGKLEDVLIAHYGLSAEETGALVAEATRRDDEAVDLYAFTSVLKRELDEAGRQDVVRLMWEMVYADGEVSEFEDNVVWRVAELIGVSARDRVTMKASMRAGQSG